MYTHILWEPNILLAAIATHSSPTHFACRLGYLSYTMTFFNVSEFYCCNLGHCC